MPPSPLQYDWSSLLSAFCYMLVRLSVVVALAPLFTSRALTMRTRAIFVFAISYLLIPVAASTVTPGHSLTLSFPGLLGEVATGALYGLTLSLFNEMLLLAGQIVGLQFSFSLVNLLDPASEIQTPLLGDLFQILGSLIVIAAGLDRILLASFVRSLHAVPPGSFPLTSVAGSAKTLVPLLSGSFFAALELAAPVLAATLLVEIGVALLGKLSPQLPVISLTVPLKTLTGFMLLIGSLALWPRYVEGRFAALLDTAERLLMQGVRG